MRTRLVVLTLALAGILVGATACEQGDTTVVAEGGSDATGITVDGVGTADSPPDIGLIDIGVSIEASTVAGARDLAAQAANDVIESIKDNGVQDDDVKTLNFSVDPRYEYPQNAAPRIVGYAVSNTVSVTVRDLDRLGEIIDDAVTAGGDAIRISSIRFDIDDRTAARQQARERAMDDARRKAEQLARLAVVSLGKPLSIVETAAGSPSPIIYDASAYARAAESTPIETGTASTEVRVTVRWAID